MTNFEKVGLFMSTFGQEIKKKANVRYLIDLIDNVPICLANSN